MDLLIEFKKCIVVLAGLPLSGKSTLGREISKSSNLVYLDIDQIKYDMFGESAKKRLDPERESVTVRASYQRMEELAKKVLGVGNPVLLVATYSKKIGHQELKQLSEKFNAPLKFFLLSASEEETNRRLGERNQGESLSNIRTWEDFQDVQSRYEMAEDLDVINIDTTKPVEECKNKILDLLTDLKK